jgi:hypothetical protein
MFPAYNPSNIEKKATTPSSSSLFPIKNVVSVDEQSTSKLDWLKNESFKAKSTQAANVEPILVKSDSSESSSESSVELITCIGGSSDDERQSDRKRKKKSKKKKKESKKHKKKKHKTKSESEEASSHPAAHPLMISEINKRLLNSLFDSQYKAYFDRFSKEQLKSFVFYEDLPGLVPRNAFKLNTTGDKNNICFESAHYKIVPKYNVAYDPFYKSTTATTKKKLTRKQLRRQILNQTREKRYFVQVKNMKPSEESKNKRPVSDLAQSTLSNRMWLYLEMKNELDSIESDSQKADLTSDYVKYLDENKNDVARWLEFINYQSKLYSGLYLFERKQSIFDRAMKENPSNFRLKIENVKLRANSIEMLNINFYNSADLIESEFLGLLASESFRLTEIKLNQYATFNLILANLLEIWTSLIDFFVNNNSSNIFVDRVKQSFVKCFNFFLNNPSNSIQSILSHFLRTNEYFSGLVLDLVDKYCLFLSRCGYVEKSIGIYQALLDFNFYSNHAKFETCSKMRLFELYWDIGLPKFGETFSQDGWLNCLENREAIFKSIELAEQSQGRNEDILDEVETNILDKKSVRIEYRWLEIENLRSVLNWYPFYPRVVIGESADDCADPDRLVSFEDDLKFLLFEINSDHSKFKLLVKFLKQFGLFKIEEDCLDFNQDFTRSNDSENDSYFLEFINTKLKYFAFNTTSKPAAPFFGHLNFLETLYVQYCGIFEENPDKKNYDYNDLKKLIKLFQTAIKHFTDFIRNCLLKSEQSIKNSQIKTSLIIMQWQFELEILYQIKKWNSKLKNVNDCKDYFDFEQVKQNLLNKAKSDLSLEVNRANFNLWKQYGHLKWLLNCSDSFSQGKQSKQLKETRKVFDTLLNTSASAVESTPRACIDIYSLCVDYVLIELDLFYRPFGISLSRFRPITESEAHLFTYYNQSNLFDSNRKVKANTAKKTEYEKIKESMSEILINSCLNKSKN